MNTLLFDIETGPLPETELEKVKPHFNAPSNFRDMGKIAAAVMEKEMAWKEQAALSALSGRVLAIGCLEPGQRPKTLENDEEPEILRAFWRLCREQVMTGNNRAIGFNIHGFDLPFLLRRSWRLGVPVPADLRQGRYWNHHFIDLLDLWMLQDRERVSLARLCAFFDLGEKLGNGADFARLWERDRVQARAYLERDLELIQRLAAAMGVLSGRPGQKRDPAAKSSIPARRRRSSRERARTALSPIAPLTYFTE